jgi:hypothetical protein
MHVFWKHCAEIKEGVQLHSALGMRVVCPVIYLGTERDDGGVEGIDWILETELATGEAYLLSKITKERVIALTEESAGAMLVLIGEVRLRRGAGNAEVVQVTVGRMKPIAYLTQGHTVGKLTEYHAHKVTPCIESLGIFVRPVLLCERFDYFFR